MLYIYTTFHTKLERNRASSQDICSQKLSNFLCIFCTKQQTISNCMFSTVSLFKVAQKRSSCASIFIKFGTSVTNLLINVRKQKWITLRRTLAFIGLRHHCFTRNYFLKKILHPHVLLGINPSFSAPIYNNPLKRSTFNSIYVPDKNFRAIALTLWSVGVTENCQKYRAKFTRSSFKFHQNHRFCRPFNPA